MTDQPVRRSTRIAAFTGAFLLFAGAVGLWLSSDQTQASAETPAVAQAVEQDAEALQSALYPDEPEPLLAAPPPPRALNREEKRFARLDRNDDGRIQQSEYLAARRRNFDKLDTNRDGRVSFEEYAAQGIEKFAKADANRDGVLNAAEFATTAPKPRAPTASASRQCPPCAMAAASDDG